MVALEVRVRSAVRLSEESGLCDCRPVDGSSETWHSPAGSLTMTGFHLQLSYRGFHIPVHEALHGLLFVLLLAAILFLLHAGADLLEGRTGAAPRPRPLTWHCGLMFGRKEGAEEGAEEDDEMCIRDEDAMHDLCDDAAGGSDALDKRAPPVALAAPAGGGAHGLLQRFLGCVISNSHRHASAEERSCPEIIPMVRTCTHTSTCTCVHTYTRTCM